MPVLRLTIRHDGILSVVAPLGAAASVGTALVVDLDPGAPPLVAGGRTLAELLEEGPTAGDLVPRRRGVAVLPSGGARADDAGELLEALARGWPFVVERRPVGGTTVAPIFGRPTDAVVHQPTGLAPVPADLPGLVLPRLSTGTVRRLLAGRLAGGRWVRAWREVWSAA